MSALFKVLGIYFRKGYQVVFKELYYWFLRIKSGGKFRPLNITTKLRINPATGDVQQLFSFSEFISPLYFWLIILGLLAVSVMPLLDPRRPGQFLGTVAVQVLFSLLIMGWFFANEEFIGEALTGLVQRGAENLANRNAPPIPNPAAHVEL